MIKLPFKLKKSVPTEIKLKPNSKKHNQVTEVMEHLTNTHIGKEKVNHVTIHEQNTYFNKVPKLNEHEYVVQKGYDSTINIFSKNYEVYGTYKPKYVTIDSIIRRGSKTITDLHQIKTNIDLLKKFCKEKRLPEIRISTWMFETFPGFGEYLKFEPVNTLVERYKKILVKNKIQKITHIDLVSTPSIVHYIKLNKDGAKSNAKMHLTLFKDIVDFPDYVCKIR
jgi:hypothetical protein